MKGETPVIVAAGSWKNLSLAATIICTPQGRKPKLFLKGNPGAVNAEKVLQYLRGLKRHRAGRKLLFFWDGLMAHRAKIVAAFLKENRSWLRVVRFPAYAPELNPPEYLWSAMKTKDLANLRPDGLSAVGRAVKKSYRRIRKKPDLLAGFLKASGLF
jgi:transposase